MKKPTVKLILVGLICLSAALSRAGRDYPWDPVDPSDWKVVQGSENDITDAAMLFEKISSDERDLAKVIYILHRRIRIVSDAGRKWGDVIVPNLKAKHRIRNIYGRTVLPNGQILPLTKDHIFEKDIFEVKGSKIRQTSFSMPGVTDNCIVEYRIEYAHQGLSERFWYFQKAIFLFHGELHWRFFRGKGLPGDVYGEKYEEAFIPNWMLIPATREVSIEQLPSIRKPKEIKVTIDNVAPFKSEPYGLWGSVLRDQFNYYYSSRENRAVYWGTQSKNRGKWLKKFCRKCKRVRKTIKAFSGLRTEEEKIKAAYAWLQNNINNTRSAVGDDNGKYRRNRSVDDVVKRGYGTPTDINTVFHAMLQEMGIDSTMAFVVNRNRHVFNPKAKYWQFDGSLVAVPSIDSRRGSFFSPGDEYLPAGFVPWYNEGFQAFLIENQNRQFMSVPFSDAAANTIQRTIDLSLSSDLRLTGKGKEAHTGHAGRKIRLKGVRGGETRRREAIEGMLAATYSDAEVDAVTFQEMDNPESPVVLEFTVAFTGQEEKMGGKLLLQPTEYLGRANNPFQTDKRVSPILFPFASQTDEVLTIALPDGWEMEALPSPARFTNRAGSCAASFSVKGRTLTFERKFRVERAYYLVEDYAAVKELFQFRQELDNLSIILKESGT